MLVRFDYPVFEITIIYKSGAKMSFKVSEFTVSNKRNYEWKSIDDGFKPLLLGVDEIVAVYQTDAWCANTYFEVSNPTGDYNT